MTIFSCTPRPINNQLKIYGHNLGDTVNTDFVELEKYGENFGLVAFKQDERFTARTMKNHLFEIWASSLTDKEFKEFKNILTKELEQEPEHFIGKTHYGLDIKGEEFYWKDTITHNEYSLWITYKDDSIYSMTIENKSITDSIGNAFIKDYRQETIIELAKPN